MDLKSAICLIDRLTVFGTISNKGDLFPVIASTSEFDMQVFFNDLKLPYRAHVGSHRVSFIRDTGCSISLTSFKLVLRTTIMTLVKPQLSEFQAVKIL
jgi:hypothetical protein